MSADLQAARDLLPWWVTWGGFLFVLVVPTLIALLVTVVLVRVTLRRLRSVAGEHWTERARVLWPLRGAAGLNAVFLPIVAGLGALYRGALSPVPLWLYVAAPAALAFLIAYYGRFLIEREVSVLPHTFRASLRNVAVLPLYAPHWLATAAALLFLPDRFNLVAVVGLILVFLCYVFGVLSNSLVLSRKLGLITTAPVPLQRAVTRAVGRAGVLPHRVLVSETRHPNAFAVPRSKSLYFTRSLLAVLDEPQLEAVTAHELGHLAEPPAVVRLRTLLAFNPFPMAALQPVLGTFGPVGAAALILLTVLPSLFIPRIFRKMEVRADTFGHSHQGEEGVYAGALERIHEAALVPAVVGTGQVHPNLYDRMVTAGVTPAYPRPRPPSPWVRLAGFAPALFAVMIGLLAPWLQVLVFDRNDSVAAVHRRAAIGRSFDVWRLGAQAAKRGERLRAATFYRAAAALEPDNSDYLAQAAAETARAGQCADAVILFRRAVQRWRKAGEDPDGEWWLNAAARAIERCRRQERKSPTGEPSSRFAARSRDR